jgi:rhodanese-related sulfurtransferase
MIKGYAMKNSVKIITSCFVLLSTLLSQTAVSDPPLTDQQKKEIVYQMYSNYKKEFPSIKDITPLEAMKQMDSGRILFVDIRTPAEMEVSMLPNAISKEDYLKNISTYASYTIVAYCTISYRSGKFCEEMEKKGIRIFNLKGGILAWVHEGGKVYDAKGETKRVHVHEEKWNYLPQGYEPVMFGFLEKYL